MTRMADDQRGGSQAASRADGRQDYGLQARAQETGGDVEKAVLLLRERGISAAARRSPAGRPARA